jgi:exodeoxyribonuclease X
MTHLFVALDTETTGLDPKIDRVVEIGWTKLRKGVVSAPRGILVNPGRPIPPEASAIHHIIDEDVATSPMIEAAAAFAAKDWEDGGSEIVYVAHNAAFDRQFLPAAIIGDHPWICTHKCSLRIFPEAKQHTNQALRYHLKPEGLDRELAKDTHRAGPDTYVTAFNLRELLKRATVEQLIQWSNEPALLITCYFKKYKGTPWREVPPDYLQWVIRQPDMEEDIKYTANYWLNNR